MYNNIAKEGLTCFADLLFSKRNFWLFKFCQKPRNISVNPLHPQAFSRFSNFNFRRLFRLFYVVLGNHTSKFTTHFAYKRVANVVIIWSTELSTKWNMLTMYHLKWYALWNAHASMNSMKEKMDSALKKTILRNETKLRSHLHWIFAKIY